MDSAIQSTWKGGERGNLPEEGKRGVRLPGSGVFCVHVCVVGWQGDRDHRPSAVDGIWDSLVTSTDIQKHMYHWLPLRVCEELCPVLSMQDANIHSYTVSVMCEHAHTSVVEAQQYYSESQGRSSVSDAHVISEEHTKITSYFCLNCFALFSKIIQYIHIFNVFFLPFLSIDGIPFQGLKGT